MGFMHGIFRLILFFSSYCIATSHAQQIFFKQSDFREVETEKLIFLDFYTTWCGPCKWMDKNVFTDSAVAKFANSHFTSFKYDAEKSIGKELARKYMVVSYPTYIFLKPNGETILIKDGAGDKESFLHTLNVAIEESKSDKTIAQWEMEYHKKKTDTAFVKKYLFKRMKLALNNNMVLENYFNLLDSTTIEKSENQWIIYGNTSLFEGDVYHYLLSQVVKHASYKDVGIIKLIDPKSKILDALQHKAQSVSPETFGTLDEKMKSAVHAINQTEMGFWLDYLPIKATMNYQTSNSTRLLNVLFVFENKVIGKLSPDKLMAMNQKMQSQFIAYYKKKGTFDSLMKQKNFQSLYERSSTAFSRKIERSFDEIADYAKRNGADTVLCQLQQVEESLKNLFKQSHAGIE